MKKIRIIIRGRELPTSVDSEIVSGHVLVPLKETAHSLGVLSHWDGSELILEGEKPIRVTPKEACVRVGNRQEVLPVVTKLKEGQILAPAGAIASWFGAKLIWERNLGALIFLQEEQLAGKKIVLDPGHGGKDLGASGLQVAEKDLTLAIAGLLGQLLRGAGAEVKYTRQTDSYLSLKSRVQLAHELEPELFLSIHSNYFHDPVYSGTETYYFNSWQGQRLANLLQRELAAELDTEDRGAREASFYLLRLVRAPAALVKVLYLSNPTEESLATDSWFHGRSALALYRGIKGFFS